MNKLAHKILSKTTLIILVSLFSGNLVMAQNGLEIEPKPSHYVFPEFVKGTAKLKNGIRETTMLNYNILTEEMIFDNKGTKLAMTDLDRIDTVYIASKKFIPAEKVFYEVAVEAPIALFIQHKGNVLSAGTPAGYGGTSQTAATTSISMLTGSGNIYKLKLPDGYNVTNATLYWIRKGNTFYRANSPRQVEKIIPEKAKEIKQFVKEQDTDFKRTADVKKLVTYINTLL